MRFTSVSRRLALAVATNLVCLVAWGTGVSAQETRAESAASAESSSTPERPAARLKEQKTGKEPARLTPEREAVGIRFAEQHHPELTQLLDKLRASRPREFERAIRELYQESERLARVRDRDEAGYKLQLEAWQAKSRGRLLAARMMMNEEDRRVLREELRANLVEQDRAQLAVMEHERRQLSDRVAKLDGEIEKRKTSQQQTIDQRLENLMKSAENSAKKKNPNRPKPKGEKKQP